MAVRGRGEERSGRALDSARRLTALLRYTAEVLESSARLAEQHAEREEGRGRLDAAASERDIARRAHAASQRARAEAERRAVWSAGALKARPDAGLPVAFNSPGVSQDANDGQAQPPSARCGRTRLK
jgi:hypothetical protein